MAIDDDRQAAEVIEFRKKLDGTRAWLLDATMLLEEEHRTTTILAKEAHATMALIEPPLPTSPMALTVGTAPSSSRASMTPSPPSYRTSPSNAATRLARQS
jgi:hypothetical protein